MLRHPRARERDRGVRCHVRSGDNRDRDRDRPKVTVGRRTAESGVGAWVSVEAALTKNCHRHGNVETVVACRLPGRCRHRESSRQGTPHPRPLSSAVSRRGLALRCRTLFGVVLIQARVGIVLRKVYINGNRIDQGTKNAKYTGFALKYELSFKKMYRIRK